MIWAGQRAEIEEDLDTEEDLRWLAGGGTVQDLRLAGGGDRRIWAGRPAVEIGGSGLGSSGLQLRERDIRIKFLRIFSF